MIVYAFGNLDLENDNLPLKILPRLQERFPEMQFKVLDPNEDWDLPPRFSVIDTVEGISAVRVFADLDQFIAAPRVTMHDFDALANLRFLKKLGKFEQATIIGVPPMIGENRSFEDISAALLALLKSAEHPSA